MSAPASHAGRLVPLRTREEVRASIETQSAYVLELPTRLTNKVKDIVQAAIPNFRTAEINHFRRVVQFKFLPAHLQVEFYPPAKLPRGDEDNTPMSTSPVYLSLPPSPSLGQNGDRSQPDSPVTEASDLVRYFLLCPTHFIQHAELLALLKDIEEIPSPTRVFYVTVPKMAPTCTEQAAHWSETYWPIGYKNTNPYGPHPSLVARNMAEIGDEAGRWLALARTAGSQISDLRLGEPVGCVVVDRSKGAPEVVAVAGDCRWRSPTGATEPHCGVGNAMAHSVQRAIAIVAKKRLRQAGADPELLDRSLFCDIPLTEAEEEYYKLDNMSPNGYLCVDLDIYVTHEPCIMCSMAILHSRFRRCVFGQRMPLTGGMTSDKVGEPDAKDGGLELGIFWRPSELNWKFLTWEMKDEEDPKASVKDGLHV